MTEQKMHHHAGTNLVRLCESDALHAVRLGQLYPDLAEHNPDAIRLTGAVVKAFQDKANGHTPMVRCEQTPRYRQAQFAAEKKLHLAEVCGIALEGEIGREVAAAGLRVLAEAIGYRLVAQESSTVTDRRRAAIGAVAQFGRTTEAVVTALEDDQIDEREDARIDREMEECETRVRLWKAARSARKGAK